MYRHDEPSNIAFYTIASKISSQLDCKQIRLQGHGCTICVQARKDACVLFGVGVFDALSGPIYWLIKTDNKLQQG